MWAITVHLAFMLLEVLVGAGLVVFELVAGNDSLARAAVLALYLANTFILLALLALTARWGSGGEPLRLHWQGGRIWLFALVLLAATTLTGTVQTQSSSEPG